MTYAIPLVALAVAALVAGLSAPLFARHARGMGLVVPPRVDRWHKRPTPLGGAAIALGALVVCALFLPLGGPSLVIVGCAGAAFALGLIDDFRHLAPATKLVGQVVVASALAFGGVQVEIIEIPPIAFLVTVFWVVGLMNAMNLLDNMDGLASGVAVIAAAVLGLVALPEDPFAALVASATAGAALGFLVHNFHPARMFMGDAGSLLLGFLLATVALLNTASGAANVGLAVLGPLVVLALPILDTAVVTTLRRRAGRPISQGGRDHLSHRLAALGLSDRGAVLFLYAVAALLAGLGVVLDAVSSLVAPLFALAVVVLILFAAFLAEVDIYGVGRRARDGETTQGTVGRGIATVGRFGAEIALDVVLLTIAYYLGYLIRYEGQPTSDWMALFVRSVPIVVGLQLLALAGLGVYRTLWRYLSVADAVSVVRSTTIGTAAAALALVIAYRFEDFSRAVFLMDWLIATALIIGTRSFLVWLRHWFSLQPRPGSRKVLIVGASEGGALVLRVLMRASETSYSVVGFLDDDPGKRYRRVGGVAIVGAVADLGREISRRAADVVVVADTDPAIRARVREACDAAGIECRELTVPV